MHRFASCLLAVSLLFPVAALAQDATNRPTIELNLNALDQLKQEQQKQPEAAPEPQAVAPDAQTSAPASDTQAAAPAPDHPRLVWIEGPKGIPVTQMEKHTAHHKKKLAKHRKEAHHKKPVKEAHKKMQGAKAPAYPANPKPMPKAKPPVHAAPVKPASKPVPAAPKPAMPAPQAMPNVAVPSLPAPPPPSVKAAPAPVLPAPPPPPAMPKPAPAAPMIPPPPATPKPAIPLPPAPQAAIPTPPPAPTAKEPPAPPVAAMNEALSGKPPAANTTKPSLSINFNPTDTSLPLSVQPELDARIKELKANPSLRVQLTAYAASAGDQPSTARRIALSRALSVRAYLIDHGVDTMRILVQAEGDKNPGGNPDRVDVFLAPMQQ